MVSDASEPGVVRWYDRIGRSPMMGAEPVLEPI
jgi:hypothetical protein